MFTETAEKFKCWFYFAPFPFFPYSIQRMPEIISVLAARLIFRAAGSFNFLSSFCQYFPLEWNSVPLDCLSHRNGSAHMQSTGQMKNRWETFNFKIKHENVDNLNWNPSAGLLKGFCLSIEPQKSYFNLVIYTIPLINTVIWQTLENLKLNTF